VRQVILVPVIDGETDGYNRSVQIHCQRMSVRHSTNLSVAKMHDVLFLLWHQCCNRRNSPTDCDRGCANCSCDCLPFRRLRTLCCRSFRDAKTKDFRCVCAGGSNRWARAPRNPKSLERWRLMTGGSLEIVRLQAIQKWNSDVARGSERSKVSVGYSDVRSRLVRVGPFPAFQEQTWQMRWIVVWNLGC